MGNDSLSTAVPPCHSFLITFFLCCCVGPLHGLQPFRINLLQHGTYMHIISSKEDLLQCELSASEHFSANTQLAPEQSSPRCSGNCLLYQDLFSLWVHLCPVPGAPPLSSLTLEFPVFFLTFFLVLISWAMFCPFLTMLSQRHHLLHW